MIWGLRALVRDRDGRTIELVESEAATRRCVPTRSRYSIIRWRPGDGM